MSRLRFTLEKEASGSRARATTFHTLHGEVRTPLFMPVGTHANVRGQRVQELKGLGYSILLANTYHLLLRPGAEVFRKMGGIQKFMNWGHSVLTDSGGFQIFSLPNERVMTEEGAIFTSYVDNRRVFLSPEVSIEMQKAIGSDIMMVLDQCVPSTVPHAEARAAMELTHRWAKRSLDARGDSLQSMFAIVQGACYPDLRRESAKVLTGMPFDGFAIGGLAVGEGKQELEEMVEITAELLPKNLPRYLMGVGTPLDILEAVHRGVDMFDCILPMALGQQGVAFTSTGKRDIRRGANKFKEEPLDPNCACLACQEHSVGYLHHLIRANQSLGGHLVAAHNLQFYSTLVKEMRASLLEDRFSDFYREKRETLALPERIPPAKSKKKLPRPTVLGEYEVHQGKTGKYSIRHIPSSEVMHSVNDPQEEAKILYLEQSKFLEKIQGEGTPLVIWDVGLGAAINAMSVVRAYEENKGTRPVHLVSFERDMDSLRLALTHLSLFEHLKHGGPVTVLEKNEWKSKVGDFRWTLLKGDFLETMKDAPTPDLIFFDPFSYKTDADAWTADSFRKVFEKCGHHDTEFFTYSSSTAVRALLLNAGFFVAKGVPTGPKAETTVAQTLKAYERSKREMLSQGWLGQWERSGVKFPDSISEDLKPIFEKTIRSHDQFLIDPSV